MIIVIFLSHSKSYFQKKEGSKVIHSNKNLFCYVAHICNLVQEFNGLVSKRVDRKVSPFYFIKIDEISIRFFTQIFSSFLIFSLCFSLGDSVPYWLLNELDLVKLMRKNSKTKLKL